MKHPKFTDLKFNSREEFEKWLHDTTYVHVKFRDYGQDVLSMWIHKSGEILHCGFQSGMYAGKFVDTEKLFVGNLLFLWDNEYNKYYPCGLFLIEEISKREPDEPTKDSPSSTAVTDGRWVPVTEGLPEPLKAVWLTNGRKMVCLGCRVESEGGWHWAVSNGVIYAENGEIVTECESDDLNVQFWHSTPKLPVTNLS